MELRRRRSYPCTARRFFARSRQKDRIDRSAMDVYGYQSMDQANSAQSAARSAADQNESTPPTPGRNPEPQLLEGLACELVWYRTTEALPASTKQPGKMARPSIIPQLLVIWENGNLGIADYLTRRQQWAARGQRFSADQVLYWAAPPRPRPISPTAHRRGGPIGPATPVADRPIGKPENHQRDGRQLK